MKKISALTLLIICLLFLGGCWDKHELEDNTFAILLGIDMAENHHVVVTVAFPLTQTDGSTTNGGADTKSGGYSMISVKAPTVAEGLNMFSSKLAGPLALYTVKTIVLSEEIAQSDMLQQIISSWRHKEIRNTANVLVSECKAVEFIEARINNPLIDPLRQEELLLEQANASANYKPIGLLELLINLKFAGGDGVTMYGGIAAKNEDDGSGTGTVNGVKEGYLPSEIPIDAENKSQISGLAVFHGGKMVGTLNSLEAQVYAMLMESNTKKTLNVADPLDPAYDLVVEVFPGGQNRIISQIVGGQPVFQMDLNLRCTVTYIQSGIDYALPQNHVILTTYLENFCAEKMMSLIRKIQKEYHADILKLGYKLAYHFSTINAWEMYDWPEKYKDAEITVRVNMNVERNGLSPFSP